jgi:hypothetical protein
MTVITMEDVRFHSIIRFIAKVISYIFHPLFLPVYLGYFFIYILRLFPEQDAWHQTVLLLTFFLNYTLLPAVSLLLLKGLGFVSSIYLNTQKDRIIPFVITGIFYFWVWWVFKNMHYPDEIQMFGLAAFITSSAGLIANSFFKISMHALSLGVITALMMIISFDFSTNFGPYLIITFLVTGLVCTSRLVNTDHTPFEVYAGLFVGMLCQLIAWHFV